MLPAMLDEAPSPGRIIYLNGASSAGKTSIALELQKVLREPHLLLGIDTFIRMFPPRLFGSADGWRFVDAGDGALRVERGIYAQRAFDAMYDAVTALSLGGSHLIFDDVMTSPDLLRRLLEAWRGREVLLVGVRCPVEVVEARERARGDRAIGLARGSSAIAHQYLEYDVEVDTNALSPTACAEAIVHFLQTQPYRAFARLTERPAS
jgi:chloramphenicol 3-O phosphotransferase